MRINSSRLKVVQNQEGLFQHLYSGSNSETTFAEIGVGGLVHFLDWFLWIFRIALVDV